MKKLTAIAASAALALSIGVSAPTVAVAKGASEEVDLCKDLLVPLEIFSSTGECISAIRSGPAAFCHSDASETFRTVFGLKNDGQCVAFIRSNQN
jgi:hypothetical protein